MKMQRRLNGGASNIRLDPSEASCDGPGRNREIMTPRSWHRPGSGILVILVAIGLLILTLATGKFTVLVGKLYSPYTAFIAVIMIVEYIILKGADRTALYRRELEAARAIRREDLLALRQMESRLAGHAGDATRDAELAHNRRVARGDGNRNRVLDHIAERELADRSVGDGGRKGDGAGADRWNLEVKVDRDDLARCHGG